MPVTREKLAAQKRAKIQRILEIVATHVWRYGYQPSLREIAAIMGWESPCYVQTLLTHHFKENYGGRRKLHSRAIHFDWQRYVTKMPVSWHNDEELIQYPTLGAPAKGAAKRKLGQVSQPLRHGVLDDGLRPILRNQQRSRRRKGSHRRSANR